MRMVFGWLIRARPDGHHLLLTAGKRAGQLAANVPSNAGSSSNTMLEILTQTGLVFDD